MNNSFTQPFVFAFISQFDAISPEAINPGQHLRERRATKRNDIQRRLYGSLLNPGPYLVPMTRWIE